MYLREQVSRRQVLRMLGGLALAAAVPRAGQRQAAAEARDALITNGRAWVDARGEVIQAHGGSVLRAGSRYYWFGEDRREDARGLIACYASDDLVHWDFRGHMLAPGDHPELEACKLERPKVIYNPRTRQFVMWMHYENAVDYSLARTAVAISRQPDGPYTYLGSFRPLGNESRDMTVFQDEDGTAYLVSASNKLGGANDTLAVYRLTEDYLQVAAFEVWLFEGQYREAPAVVKHRGIYFLFTSQAAGWYPSQAAYATARSMSGPWSPLAPLGNPSTFNSQGTYVLPVGPRHHRAYIFMADRWHPGDLSTSQYIWLPLHLDGVNGTARLEWYSTWCVDARSGRLELPPRTNLAAGRAATASSTGAGSSPRNANDEQYQTRWVAANNSWPAWWQVDLGRVLEVREVDISWYMVKGSEGYYKYKIHYSLDGDSWRTIDRTDNTDYGFTADRTSFSARYVRVELVTAVLHNNPYNWYTPSLYEVKLWG